MKQVCLTLIKTNNEMGIFAAYSQIFNHDDAEFKAQAIVNSKETTRQILNHLEKCILENTGKEPDLYDGLRGTKRDNYSNHAEDPRHIHYSLKKYENHLPGVIIKTFTEYTGVKIL